MALPGETKGAVPEIVCDDCGSKLPLQVLHSPAGYYIGYYCPECGPYSRESHYMRTKELAEDYLRVYIEENDCSMLR